MILVAGDEILLETVIIHSLVVFSITLTVTKSKILGCKREFVKERYEASARNGKPCFFHEWWNAMWQCSMCCGFWVALFTSFLFFSSFFEILIGTLCAYGLNWIFHCLEDYLYWNGKLNELESKAERDE